MMQSLFAAVLYVNTGIGCSSYPRVLIFELSRRSDSDQHSDTRGLGELRSVPSADMD